MDDTSAALSPFIEGTNVQFAFDSTSLGWLKQCPRYYEYAQIHGYRSTGLNIHLRFGQVYHSALELFDRLKVAGADYEEALDQVVDFALCETWDDRGAESNPAGHPWTTNDTAKNRETLIRSVIWYLEQFREDPAKTIVLENGRPAVELSFSLELDFGPRQFPNVNYILAGHLDRVVEFAGDTYVSDRKTTKQTLSPHYFEQFEPDNQMSLYTLATQIIYDIPVKGVIIDAVQIAVGFSRFERGMTFRSQNQLDEWLKNARYYFDLAERYAEEGYYPQNDKACFNCTFRRICSKDPSVRQTFLDSDFVKQPWNPLRKR